jgi:hypothetical protein
MTYTAILSSLALIVGVIAGYVYCLCGESVRIRAAVNAAYRMGRKAAQDKQGGSK